MNTRKGIGYTEGTNMAAGGNGSNISDRMDRVEKIVEVLYWFSLKWRAGALR